MAVSPASSRNPRGRGVEFAVGASREGERTVLWLDGEHDIATADSVVGALARAITTDHADVVVDLSGVEFLGAVTIHLLRRSRVLLRRQGRSMTLRSPSKCARRVLTLTDVHLNDPISHDDGHGVRSGS